MFSNHNGMKLEIKSKKEVWEVYKYMKIRQHTPKWPICQEKKSQGKFKINFRWMKIQTQYTKPYGT